MKVFWLGFLLFFCPFGLKAQINDENNSAPATGLYLNSYVCPLILSKKGGLKWYYEYEDIRIQFIKKLNSGVIGSFRNSPVKFVEHGKKYGNWGDQFEGFFRKFHVFLGSRHMGYFDIQMRDHVLSFDIKVNTKFRGLGLYGLFLGWVLVQFPETKSIPTMRMLESNSLNARVFKMAINERLSSLKQGESFSKELILDALKKTPVMKARARFGFERVVAVAFGSAMHLRTDYGEPLPLQESRVFRVTGRKGEGQVFELTDQGDETNSTFVYFRDHLFPDYKVIIPPYGWR